MKCPLNELCKYYSKESNVCNDQKYLYVDNKIFCGQLRAVINGF